MRPPLPRSGVVKITTILCTPRRLSARSLILITARSRIYTTILLAWCILSTVGEGEICWAGINDADFLTGTCYVVLKAVENSKIRGRGGPEISPLRRKLPRLIHRKTEIGTMRSLYLNAPEYIVEFFAKGMRAGLLIAKCSTTRRKMPIKINSTVSAPLTVNVIYYINCSFRSIKSNPDSEWSCRKPHRQNSHLMSLPGNNNSRNPWFPDI